MKEKFFVKSPKNAEHLSLSTCIQATPAQLQQEVHLRGRLHRICSHSETLHVSLESYRIGNEEFIN